MEYLTIALTLAVNLMLYKVFLSYRRTAVHVAMVLLFFASILLLPKVQTVEWLSIVVEMVLSSS
jgi:hypothetical protein